jgi:hypothetical protein
MTTRDRHIAQKKKEILKIAKQQVRLIKKAAALVSKPSKRINVNLRRIGKMMAITMQIRALEMQKQMIIAQPAPKPAPNLLPGGVMPEGPAVVGEGDRKEVIITSSGNVFVPSEMVHIPINQKPEDHGHLD